MLSPLEFFSDLFNPMLAFLPKALIVALLSSLVAGVVGTHVVLRGMAFIGDAVAHAVFPGLAIAFVLQGSLILGGALAGITTAILVAIVAQGRRVKEDSIIGVFFAGAFALGIVILSTSPGYSGSLQQFLFGSLTGVSDSDIITVAIAAVVVVAIVLALHKEIVTASVDRESAAALGVPVFALDLLLYVLVAVSVVIAVQTIGNILVLALLVTPAAVARLLTERVTTMMILAPIVGMVSSFIGVYLSWSLDLPTGAMIVLVATAFFLVAWLVAPRHGILMRRKPGTKARREELALA